MSNEQEEKIKKQTERIRELERENDRIFRDLNNQINQWQFEYGRAKELTAQLQEAQNKIMWLEKDLADTKTRCEELTVQLQTQSDYWKKRAAEYINEIERLTAQLQTAKSEAIIGFHKWMSDEGISQYRGFNKYHWPEHGNTYTIEELEAAYIGQSVNTLTDRTVYGEVKTQLCPECQLPKEAHIRGEFCGRKDTLTEDKSRNLDRANTNAGVNDNKGAGRLENQTNK